MCFILLEFNVVIGLHDPVFVVVMQIDGDIAKSSAPMAHGCVEMGMGNSDGFETPEPIYQIDRGLIDECDTIPENIAMLRLKQKGTLSDCKFWLRADTCKAGFVLVKRISVRDR